LRQVAHGGVFDTITRETFNEIDINLPSLPEQRNVAQVLSSLDDKIDLLHQQNKTLEGMAEALWRKMFVEEADEGWKKGKLGDIAEINPQRILKKNQVAPYLDMANMPSAGPFPLSWIPREYSSGMKFKNGDTIIARITPCLENGKTAYVNFLNEDEIAWGSTEYIVLSPKIGYCSEWFYFLARNDDFRDFAIQNMTGTSGRQRVSGDSIAQYEIAIPLTEKSKRFEKFSGAVMEHIKHNSIQMRTLSGLRDMLLPKLMNGEVKVRK
jgi:type I restriction enzyme S subunit